MSASKEAINREAMIELLAHIYCNVPWVKMHTSKNPWDIFNHRVRAASRKGTIDAFTAKLCNYFGLQSLPLECAEFLDILRAHENEVLNQLYLEHVPFCMRAIIRAKEIKKQKKEGGKRDGE